MDIGDPRISLEDALIFLETEGYKSEPCGISEHKPYRVLHVFSKKVDMCATTYADCGFTVECFSNEDDALDHCCNIQDNGSATAVAFFIEERNMTWQYFADEFIDTFVPFGDERIPIIDA